VRAFLPAVPHDSLAATVGGAPSKMRRQFRELRGSDHVCEIPHAGALAGRRSAAPAAGAGEAPT
jgi:hypothetical protein